MMNIQRLKVQTERTIPLMAALPYAISAEPEEAVQYQYDPASQQTVFAGRDFSTCRQDESVGFINSKSDTQKDD